MISQHLDSTAKNINQGFPLKTLRKVGRETGPLAGSSFSAVCILGDLHFTGFIISKIQMSALLFRFVQV